MKKIIVIIFWPYRPALCQSIRILYNRKRMYRDIFVEILPKYVWYNYEVVPIFKKKKKFIKIIFIWNSHQKFRIINC